MLAVAGIRGGWLFIANSTAHVNEEKICATRFAYLSGWVTLFIVGGAVFFSGHMEGGDLVYYGHLGRDPIFHQAMIGQLSNDVPPQNYIVSGYPFSYHFLPDLSQALLMEMSGNSIDVNNMYYRLYPSFIYFLLGSTVSIVCVHLFRSTTVAIFATVLLIGGANLSVIPGFGQALAHIGDVDVFWSRLFTPWDGWGVTGGAIPLIHRPAYYHGMLILFACLYILAAQGHKLRSWVLVGLVCGVLAGFNFTLAASIGICLVVLACISWLQGDRPSARSAAAGAGAALVFSLPFLAILHSTMGGKSATVIPVIEPGFIAVAKYGYLIGERIPYLVSALLLTLSMVVISFGIKLIGVPSMFRQQMGPVANPRLTLFITLLFAFNLSIALLFRWGDVSQISEIVFIQPTAWLLGLFAIVPLYQWMEQEPMRRYRKILLWLLILVPPVQGLLSANLSYRTVITSQELEAIGYIKSHAGPHDIVAFTPTTRKTEPIFVSGSFVHNFFIPALTGLRGYYSSDSYSKLQVQHYPQGMEDYARREALVKRICSSTATQQTVDALIADGVRWMLLPNRVSLNGLGNIALVMENASFSVLELSPTALFGPQRL